MNSTVKDNCYICNSNITENFKNIQGFLIRRCKECGLMWVTEGLSSIDLKSFYDESYFNSETKIGYRDYLRDEKNHRQNALDLIAKVNKFKKLSNLNILDIGCAHGFLLDELKNFNSNEIIGIEPSNHAYEYARNTLHLNVLNKELKNTGFEDNYFDIVFMIGVIEHMPDPKSLFNNVHRILKPDGLLVITTINTKGLIPLYSFKPPEHLFYFNESNLLNLVNKCGFNKVQVKTNSYVFLLYDLFHRIAEFSSWQVFDMCSDFIYKICPDFSVKILTNEMLVICKK